MIRELKNLYQYRELVWVWAMREIRIRYKQSLLGAGWAVLQPLALMAVFTVVFSRFARVPSDGAPYPVFAYLALVPWTFFATSVTFGCTSLINNINLVTKIYFPREVLPLGQVIAALLDFLIASVTFFGLLLLYRIPLSFQLLWLLLLFPVQLLLTVGITLPVAALTASFRDFRFVVPLGLQIWMFATPIVYPVSLVPARFQSLYLLNPMSSLIVAYRDVILRQTPPNPLLVVWVSSVSILLFWFGYRYFKRVETDLADVI